MTRTMMIGIAAGSAVVAVLSAAPASSQQLSYAVTTEKTATKPDPSQLERQAAELYTSPKNFRRAADLLLKAADLRDVADPAKVKNQSLAARLFYYAGDKQRGMTVLEGAADHALSVGDVLVAAELYLDASYVAQELEQGEKVRALAEKTRLLMNSPLVDARERDRVLSRING
jgi:hypothetical protein